MPESPADKAMFADSKTRMPLNGITVLDLTLARAGPTAVRHFADWGANVIRIEPPATEGEDIAGRRHGFDFQNLHRNKRAVTLNLKTKEGHEAFMRLAAKADVILENMRANVKHRLKVDYESVKAINPRIVYGSISGFGQDGPYGPRAGVDQIAQGMGGLMSITGLPGQGPVRVGIPIADLTAGNLLALGVMTALFDREKTGVGRWVTTSLLEAQIFMLDFQASRWLIAKEVAPQAGNDHPTGIPTGVFPTSDGHINIAASGQGLWERFCKAIGWEEALSDPDYANGGLRSRNRKGLNERIGAITRLKPSAYWLTAVNQAGVPCGPINDIAGVFAEPQTQHLGIARTVHHPVLGDIRVVGQPINLTDNPQPEALGATPELGQHTDAILAGLGYDAEAIADLRTRGVI